MLAKDLLWNNWTTPWKWFHPQVRHRLFAKNVSTKKTGAFAADDATPTSAETIQKYFADEIISFHSCGVTTFAPTAARDQRQVVTSSSLRPPVTWIDRDYMNIPQCCDIPKKSLSNGDCNKISHGRVIRTSVWFREHDLGQARLSTKFTIRLCFASKVQPRASFSEPRSASNANKHATFRGQHRYLPSKSDPMQIQCPHIWNPRSHNSRRALVLASRRNPSFRPLSAFSDSTYWTRRAADPSLGNGRSDAICSCRGTKRFWKRSVCGSWS